MKSKGNRGPGNKDTILFAQNLRAVRMARGLRQKDVAEKAQVAPATVWCAETNFHAIQLDTAIRMAQAVGVPMALLLGELPDPLHLIDQGKAMQEYTCRINPPR